MEDTEVMEWVFYNSNNLAWFSQIFPGESEPEL